MLLNLCLPVAEHTQGAHDQGPLGATSSRGRGRRLGGSSGSTGGGSGSNDGSDGCGSSGLFNGLRVRMGVVTGQVHWEARGASSAAAANSLAAIINSSIYKLALGEWGWEMLN